MSLRSKVIAILLILFVGYGLFDFALQRWVVYPRFLQLEREEATKNVERAVQALQRDLDLLVPSATDWGTWDDTYAFVQGLNPDYVDANLNATALEGLAVNALAFFDREGQLVWGMGYDLAAESPLELPALLSPRIEADHFLMRHLAEGTGVAGIVQGLHGPLLVVARPVLTSAGEGPPVGMILLARLLDAEAIQRIGTQARVELEVRMLEIHDGLAPGAPRPGQLAHSEIRLTEGRETTVGETWLMDVDGAPVLQVSVTTARAISARGREALWFATASMAVAGALVLLILVVGMRRTLLDPIAELTKQAVRIGSRQDLGVRINSARRDEIGVLARELDGMVEQLAVARQKLAEQSYKSGVAEMASGVLHNIGNALTPLGVKLGQLKAALASAPADEVDLAAAELAHLSLEPERRADMESFLTLAGMELAELIRRTGRDLDGIQRHVDHIQHILADQQRFSRAERVIEAVELATLVKETAGLLPEGLSQWVKLEVGPELARVSPVRAARVALQQVVSNLLINAAEAIAAQPDQGRPRRVQVSAEETLIEGQPMVHLRFADEGVGIPAEDLPRIFTRGFSTKARGSGMGLHWSANTVHALGGRLFAESEGPGRGACLHLLLPQAAPDQRLQEAA